MKAKKTIRFTVLGIILLLGLLLLDGCCKREMLLDKSWVLVQYGPKDAPVDVLAPSEIIPPGSSKILLILKDDGRFNGNDGCNSIFGNYRIERRCRIKFTNISSTLILCRENVMNQADIIRNILGTTERYRVTTKHLRLYGQDGKILYYKKNE
jgi:heat shock protein HslJ